MLNKIKNWYQIILIDKEALPGSSIKLIIDCMLKVTLFKYIIIDQIDGAGDDWIIPKLHEKQNSLEDLNSFLPLLPKVVQLDWGDFFLFHEKMTDWRGFEKVSYSFLISQTDTTIRAIDHSFIYIYTPYSAIIDILKKNFEYEDIKYGSLENLDYPD